MSGTEFKFHKLVRPLHPRRNRGWLISPEDPTFFLPRAGRGRHADGSWKAWVLSLLCSSGRPASQPAGQDHDLDGYKS